MDVGLRIRFLAGVYHATPWFRYINEGAVEWPPSPWRVLRALAGVGMRKLGWSDRGVPQEWGELASKLSQTLPLYIVPPATQTHTRHPMPVPGKKKQILMDPFVVIDRDAELLVVWKEVELDESQRDLFERLAEGLAYLGRSESLIHAESLFEEEIHGTFNFLPVSGTSSVSGEILRVLAPKTPQEYADYRQNVQLPPELDAPDVGMSIIITNTNVLSGVERTSGRSKGTLLLPPAAKWVYYELRGTELMENTLQREEDLKMLPQMQVGVYSIVPQSKHGGGGVPVSSTLVVAEAVRRKLLGAASRVFGKSEIPLLFSGHSESSRRSAEGHKHIFILPVDTDNDGILDHVLVYAKQPFGDVLPLEDVLRTFGLAVGDVKVEGMGVPQFLVFMGAYSVEDMQERFSPWFKSSQCWESATPYYFSRHPKKSQIAFWKRELIKEIEEFHGLGKVKDVEILHPKHFKMLRDGTPRMTHLSTYKFIHKVGSARVRPAISLALGVRIHFNKPVKGPIMLGHGAHFGLGQFVGIPCPKA